MISRETILQSKQPGCQVKQTERNIGIYCERIYHLLDNTEYICCLPDAFRNRTTDGFTFWFNFCYLHGTGNPTRRFNVYICRVLYKGLLFKKSVLNFFDAMSLLPTSAVASLLPNVSLNATTTASVPPALFQANPTLGLVVEVVITFLVGGHLLILTTLCLYKPWNIADLLLFSLSMADAINAAIPLQMLNILNNFIGPDLWTPASCAVFVILTYTFRIASVCTITLISGDRAILLTRPLQHHIIVTTGRARKAVVAIWLFSIFMAILPFIGVGQRGYRAGYCFYQLFDFGVVYGYIIESIGILQLVLVLICFIAIKVTSGKFVKRQSTMAASRQTGGKNQQARETAGTRQVKQMSFMMAIVVILYYISWLPYLVSFSVRVCAFWRVMCVSSFCKMVTSLILCPKTFLSQNYPFT